MSHQSTFLAQLGISLPIVQAPMAGVTDAQLVAACCEAGVLGSLGAGMLMPDTLATTVKAIRAATNKPFNVNLFILEDMPLQDLSGPALTALTAEYHHLGLALSPPVRYAPSFQEQLELVLALAPPVVSFTFGILGAQDVTRFKQRGCKVIGTATNVDEAILWEQAGADALSVQGSEAGGHRGTFLHEGESSLIGLFPLLREIRAKSTLPLFAAGGIMDGAGIAAAQCLGAEAAQMGTAFLFCDEAPVHPLYRQRLINAQGHHTRLTKAFSGKYARGIENRFMQNMENAVTYPYPLQNALTAPLRKWAAEIADADYMSLWAGQGVPLGRSMPAAELIHQLEMEWHACRYQQQS
ncbi:NAD(P)H-dependent flavin oxidoreductase [Glaciimonas soli]|uniref:Nitronate monooxygenase n=1 Tax=Glaciimonas soli TaxID=2590999 RepID=A0A843YQJ8_9BURK|nr:nitronate monooxygenase [Glaciimonas soli]MQR00257.1 nitronate monooxygenase [Glaciimonas soli]